MPENTRTIVDYGDFVMTAADYLIRQYGLLMTISDVASVLGRSPDGVRVMLYADSDLARKLKPTMIRVGRRIYFRTLQVAEELNLESSGIGH